MLSANRPLKVFLSYASQDRSVVRELYERLKAEGWIEPWLDQENLTFGQHWTTVIQDALDDTDAVIVFLSRNSVQKEGFIQRELSYAWDVSLEKPHDVIFLIPLRLDECKIPRHLQSRHWGDYFGIKKDSTYQILLRSLSKRYQQKLQLEADERERAQELARKEAERKARDKAEREAAEKAAREKAEREAAEKAAKEKAEREAAEKAAKEKEKREAAEKAAKEKEKRESAEKTAKENEKRRAARREARRVSLDTFFSKPLSLLKSRAFFRTISVAVIIAVLFGISLFLLQNNTIFIPTTEVAPIIVNSTATATNFVSPTKTKISIPTKTRVPSATPRPSTFSVYDDFSSVPANEKFDTTLWLDQGGDATINWENGYLIFSGENGGHELRPRVPSRWNISEIGKLQADLRIDNISGQNYAFTKIGIDTTLPDGNGTWWAQCRAGSFDGISAQIICDSYRWLDGPDRKYQTSSIPIEFGKFYSVSIELGTDGSYVRYHVDDKEIGFYEPDEKELLEEADFSWSIGVYIEDNTNATGAIDNVMIGN